MSVSIKVTSNLNLPTDFLTERDLRDVGELAVRKIRTRTESGIDVDGAAFRGYSPDYAQRKLEALGHGRVDLTVSGRMLNDMQVTDATDKSVTIAFVSQGGGASGKQSFIQRSRAMGAADKAQFNDPSRHFFGLSDEDEAAIVDALDKVLQQRLNQA